MTPRRVRAQVAAVGSTAVFGLLPVRTVHADPCTIHMVEAPPGTSESCTAQARAFAVVVVKGVVHLVITCNGVPYYDNLIGTNEVSGDPGPCLLSITATVTAGAAMVLGVMV